MKQKVKKPINEEALSAALAEVVGPYACEDIETTIAHLAQKIGLLLGLMHRKTGDSSDLFSVMMDSVNIGYELGGVKSPIEKIDAQSELDNLQ